MLSVLLYDTLFQSRGVKKSQLNAGLEQESINQGTKSMAV
jgi:hypothetical protein